MTLFLRDLDTLTECPLPWRNHSPSYHEWTIPPPEVDRKSHPGADKAAPMFKQSWKIDFGPENEPELAKVMEEQMERHLFGEEHDPEARTLRCNLCGGDSYV